MIQANLVAPPVAPPAVAPGTQVPQIAVDGQILTSPQAVYEAFRAQRNELRNQLSTLMSDRTAIAQRLRNGGAAEGADLGGLERRLTQLDERIIEMQKQIAAADAKVAESASVPGAVVVPSRPSDSGPPGEAFILGAIFTVFVLFPLTIAYARRMLRRTAPAAGLPKDIAERLMRIEDGVEATSIEVERIGEAQRFVTNLFMESGPSRVLGAGGMEPIEMPSRERVERRPV